MSLFGRILRTTGSFVGKAAKGIALGALDSVPILAQLRATFRTPGHIAPLPGASRLLSGWGFLLLWVYLFLRAIFGDISPGDALQIIHAALGLSV